MSSEVNRSSNYPGDLRTYRQYCDETELLIEALEKLEGSPEMESLLEAKTCLSVGTGFGQYDIMFIERFLPNLEKFIVVERDRNCTKELNVNLSEVFGGKLEVKIHTTSIESFVEKHFCPDFNDGGLYKKVDVVLAFHSLYSLEPADLLKFFKACTLAWLSSSSSGRLVVAQYGEHLCNKMKAYNCTTVDDVTRCLDSLGYPALREVTYQVKIDARDPDRVLKIFVKPGHEVPEEVLKALNELTNDKGIMEQSSKLVVFGANGR